MMDWSEEDEQLFRDVGGELMLLGYDDEGEWNFGWYPVNPLVDPRFKPGVPRLFSHEAKSLKGSGEGKTVLLYEAAVQVMGRHLDSGPQAIGDCVGWAFAGAVDLLALCRDRCRRGGSLRLGWPGLDRGHLCTESPRIRQCQPLGGRVGEHLGSDCRAQGRHALAPAGRRLRCGSRAQLGADGPSQ
jgi:hypothetical protein